VGSWFVLVTSRPQVGVRRLPERAEILLVRTAANFFSPPRLSLILFRPGFRVSWVRPILPGLSGKSAAPFLAIFTFRNDKESRDESP